jgi:hypothetical protein
VKRGDDIKKERDDGKGRERESRRSRTSQASLLFRGEGTNEKKKRTAERQ